MTLQRVVYLILIICSCQIGYAQKVMVSLSCDSSTNHYFFELQGLSSGQLQMARRNSLLLWKNLFKVYVQQDEKSLSHDDLPAMQGSYDIVNNRIRFTPQFELMHGTCYTVNLNTLQLSILLNADLELKGPSTANEFCMKESEGTRGQVTEVFPTAEQLPENLLRFYVYFSVSMGGGEVMQNIDLLDDAGNVLDDIFFDNFYHLWSPDMKRLTILFDPGRVKKGLRAHNRMGRALIPGQKYQLVINEHIMDGNGRPLSESYMKEFEVISEVDSYPKPVEWTIETPPTRSIDPLILHFPRAMDHALLHQFIRLVNADGMMVPGYIEFSNHETDWLFFPESKWEPGDYKIMVNKKLEDLAGNNLYGVFDRPSGIPQMQIDKKFEVIEIQILD